MSDLSRKWKWNSLSRVQLFATPWTTESMEFSKPEYCSGQLLPSPGKLPNPGTEHKSPALQVDSLSAEPKGSPRILEWVAFTFSRKSSQPRNRTRVSCIAGRFFTNWAIREVIREDLSRETGKCSPKIRWINITENIKWQSSWQNKSMKVWGWLVYYLTGKYIRESMSHWKKHKCLPSKQQ